MTAPLHTNQHAAADYRKMVRNFYFAIPGYALVPVLFWLGFRVTGTNPVHSAYGYGALGWMIALILRIPVSLLAKALTKDNTKMSTIVVASSGVLEEGTRLILLLATTTSFQWASSIGQGWAAVEVLYSVISGVALSTILTRTDEKAVQAKAALQEQFGNQLTTNSLYGVSERLFASALHIGWTLLVAWSPWLVIPTMVLHSTVNLLTTRWIKEHAKRAQFFIAVSGVAVFVAGLLVWTL